MGYRAHTITQEREYGSEPFGNWEQFTDDLIPALDEAGCEVVKSDNEDFFEVEKDKLEEFVNSLPSDTNTSVYPSYNNIELYTALKQAIDEAPGDWVSWEWF